MIFLHQHPQFKVLIERTASQEKIDAPSLIEKDYWIMHCLYGLKSLGLSIELKGGTSLSKGFGIIDRFSENLDIKINPNKSLTALEVKTGKNHDKEAHRKSRQDYYDWLTTHLRGKIDGIIGVERDTDFDDIPKYRSGGIRLNYRSIFPLPVGLKDGILLEVGFDQTTPYLLKDISSW